MRQKSLLASTLHADITLRKQLSDNINQPIRVRAAAQKDCKDLVEIFECLFVDKETDSLVLKGN